MFKNLNKGQKILIASSILFLIGLFTFNKIIIFITTWVYIISVTYSFNKIFKINNITIEDIENEVEHRKQYYRENKKYFKLLINSISIPMCMLGIVFVILYTFIFLFN